MNREEFEYLKDDETALLIEKGINDDPLRLALKGYSPIICTQIRNLQKAKSKIPFFYTARAIIPSLSFEQCSSTHTATHRDLRGDIAFDLTCGLGIDSYYLSLHFNKVISVEKDPILADIARYNFKKLNRDNIEVICCSAEDFISQYEGEKPDLIFIDPARRDDKGKKVFLPFDCSPNILNMMDRLLLLAAKTIFIKGSPLYDIDAVYSDLNSINHISVEIVSVDDECKEVNTIININSLTDTVTTKSIRNGATNIFSFNREELKYRTQPISYSLLDNYNYILIPDVVHYKARSIDSLMIKHYPSCVYALSSSNNGVILTVTLPENFNGKAYRIKDYMPYKPKEIKKTFKKNNISGVTIIKKGFSQELPLIKKQLSIDDGDQAFIILTEIESKKLMFIVSVI